MTNRICCIFTKDKEEMLKRIKNLEVVERYGSTSTDEDGNILKYLHTWDDGYRTLKKCPNCGNYVLFQSSEIHLMSYDVYYTDYIAVNSPQHAEELNIKYDGFEIEFEYDLPMIFFNDGVFQAIRNLKI